MAIKVAVFLIDCGDYVRKYYADEISFLERLSESDLKIAFISSGEVFSAWETGKRFDFNVAVIHMGYEIRRIDNLRLSARDVVEKMLPKNTRRIITTGEEFEKVSAEAVTIFEADHYYKKSHISEGAFLRTLRLGRVDEDEIKTRGVSIDIEGSRREGAERYLNPGRAGEGDEAYRPPRTER